MKLQKKIAKENLACRIVTVQRKQKKDYLVKWKGEGDEETTWERAEDLKHCTKID